MWKLSDLAMAAIGAEGAIWLKRPGRTYPPRYDRKGGAKPKIIPPAPIRPYRTRRPACHHAVVA